MLPKHYEHQIRSKRYTLYMAVQLVGGKRGAYKRAHRGTNGNTVSDYTWLSLGSDNLDYLRGFWTENEYARSYATTIRHIIWDNHRQREAIVLSGGACCLSTT